MFLMTASCASQASRSSLMYCLDKRDTYCEPPFKFDLLDYHALDSTPNKLKKSLYLGTDLEATYPQFRPLPGHSKRLGRACEWQESEGIIY